MAADSRGWLALLALVVALFALMFLVSPLFGLLGVDAPLAVVVAAALALVAVALRRRRSAARVGDASVWDLIPSWQYDGRHVESGGLTRDEQERALGEIQREAERREGE